MCRSQKKQLVTLLQILFRALKSAKLLTGNCQVIQGAKVPIIKCEIRVRPGGPVLAADISLATANGAAAVYYVARQLTAIPPLRPLVLVVKALLKVSTLTLLS